VGSIKNTTEEVTETDDERKYNGGRGSWRKGNGRGLECPLTLSVMAALFFWRSSLKHKSPDDVGWKEALEDVGWALKCMVKTVIL